MRKENILKVGDFVLPVTLMEIACIRIFR